MNTQASSRDLPSRWGLHHAIVALYYVALLSCLGVGVYVRFLGYFSRPLWFDEAWRANLMSHPVDMFRERTMFTAVSPIGYILLNSAIAAVRNTDYLLRLTSLVPAIVSIVLVYRIAVRLTNHKLLHVLVVFVVALNPMLIDYSKELKPYSLDLMLHLSLILLLLTYPANASFRRLVAVVGFAYVSLFMASNAIFLMPAVLITTGLDAIHHRNSKHLKVIGLWVCLVFASLLGLYLTFFVNAPARSILIDFYGDTFYWKPFVLKDVCAWILHSFDTLIVNFNNPRVFLDRVDPAIAVSNMILPGLYVLGVVVSLARRQYRYLAVLLLPVLTVLVFALLIKWPFGWTRVNIFMCGYFVFVVLLGLDALLKVKFVRHLVSAYVIALMVVHVPVNLGYFSSVTMEDILSPLRYLQSHTETGGDKAPLGVNGAGSKAFLYYTRYNTVTSRTFQGVIENREVLVAAEAYNDEKKMSEQMRDLLLHRKGVWFIYSHLSTSEAGAVKAVLQKYGIVRQEQHYENAGIYFCESRIFGGV